MARILYRSNEKLQHEGTDGNQEATWNRLEVNESKPTKEEIKIAVQNMGNGKSPGTDNIPAELWKADIHNTV